MLLTRVLTAIVLLSLFVGSALWAPEAVFDGLLLLVISLAVFEWMRLLQTRSLYALLISFGFFLAGLFALQTAPAVAGAMAGEAGPLVLLYAFSALFWVIGAPVSMALHASAGGQRVAAKILAIALLWAAWLALVQADGQGKLFLLSVCLLVWMADTAAYFFGRAFGRRKLAPRISPGKTWEGVVGALIANLVLALVLAKTGWLSTAVAPSVFVGLDAALTTPLFMLVIVLITFVGVIGDLYESLLKRLANVKDSGRLLPGHGGVFDRIDALIAVFPVTMFVLSVIR